MFLVAIWTISGNNCYSVTVGAVRNAGPTVRSWAPHSQTDHKMMSSPTMIVSRRKLLCFIKKTSDLSKLSKSNGNPSKSN
jgi:hypothetical protein